MIPPDPSRRDRTARRLNWLRWLTSATAVLGTAGGMVGLAQRPAAPAGPPAAGQPIVAPRHPALDPQPAPVRPRTVVREIRVRGATPVNQGPAAPAPAQQLQPPPQLPVAQPPPATTTSTGSPP